MNTHTHTHTHTHSLPLICTCSTIRVVAAIISISALCVLVCNTIPRNAHMQVKHLFYTKGYDDSIMVSHTN
jgi:hypothetical protein